VTIRIISIAQQPAGHREKRAGAGHVQRPFQGRRHHSLDRAIEVGAPEVAAQHVAGAKLAGDSSSGLLGLRAAQRRG
jgi:hypothetical protein